MKKNNKNKKRKKENKIIGMNSIINILQFSQVKK